jgi:class 3 adenylate cyclase/pimeloyl-ACP methyl ester carboxylesterase
VNDTAVEVRDTRYAKTDDDVYLAYQATGAGPVDVVWYFDSLGNVDVVWERPEWEFWFESLSSFCRLILLDRRGTGLSSRNVSPPNLETQILDLKVVLDQLDSSHTVLGGNASSGAVNAMFAATFPNRVRSLIWYAPSARAAWAPDYPWGVGPEFFAREQRALEDWGTTQYAAGFREQEELTGHVLDEAAALVVAKQSRHTATPDVAREQTRIWYETDVRSILPSVTAPVLLLCYDANEGDVEQMRYIEDLLPNADAVVVHGEERMQDFGLLVDEIRGFLGAGPAPPELDSILATVLFTDIVDSTAKQAALGDRGWKDVLERHHATVRTALKRWRGVEIDTAGDGFYATFDGPARAIRCALAIQNDAADALGLQVRAGVHTGECVAEGGTLSGIALHIGARVAAEAGAREVLVSSTVKDLVAGAGLAFADRGARTLKGVPGEWRLYAVRAGTA